MIRVRGRDRYGSRSLGFPGNNDVPRVGIHGIFFSPGDGPVNEEVIAGAGCGSEISQRASRAYPFAGIHIVVDPVGTDNIRIGRLDVQGRECHVGGHNRGGGGRRAGLVICHRHGVGPRLAYGQVLTYRTVVPVRRTLIG